MFKDYNINQLTLPFDFEVLIPDDDISVAIHEFVESMPDTLFKGFEHTYGTSSYHPKMMVKIILCGYAQSVTSGRKIEALLTDSIRMMWLADRQVPSYRTINRFRVHPEMTAVIGEAFVQFRTALQSAALIDDDAVFIDGTKIEADANKYSFVFRKTVEKNQEKMRAQSQMMYDTLLEADIIPALKAEAETPVTEQDLNAMHQQLASVESTLTSDIDASEDVDARKSKRKQRSTIRKAKKKCKDFMDREMKYNAQLDTMGARNSFSKTDADATFMRMKDDHMRNGQLKAGYNIQAATYNQFVLGYDIFPNPTDTRTLEPFLNTMLDRFKYLPQKLVADAGYGSEFNYETMMERFQRIALIPYATFFKEQKKRHQNDEMHPDNWHYDETHDQYICPDGRRIPFKQYRQRTDAYGFTRHFKIYESLDCTECPLYDACTKSKKQSSKQIHKNMNLEYYKAEARKQLSSKENAALYSQRKIDVETVFGNLKANLAFKRFSVRGKQKVNIEMGFAFMALNIRKWVKMKHPFQSKHKTGTHTWVMPSMCPGF